MGGSWKSSIECEIGQRQKVGRSGGIGKHVSHGHLACQCLRAPSPPADHTPYTASIAAAHLLISLILPTLTHSTGPMTSGQLGSIYSCIRPLPPFLPNSTFSSRPLLLFEPKLFPLTCRQEATLLHLPRTLKCMRNLCKC